MGRKGEGCVGDGEEGGGVGMGRKGKGGVGDGEEGREVWGMGREVSGWG